MALIIGGLARSGTTLLWRLCNLHPEIKLTYEFREFYALGKPYRKYISSLLGRMWSRGIFSNRILGPTELKHRSLRKLYILRCLAFAAQYSRSLYTNDGSIIDAMTIEKTLNALFPEARIVGDKYPGYVFKLDELTAQEGLFCLIIYRDCRDVASSMLKKIRKDWKNQPWTENMNTAGKIAARWVNAIEQMERYSDRIKTINYETLIRRPESELRLLGKWLGVQPSSFPKEIIRDDSIGKYRTGLTDKELEDVMKIAGPTMARQNLLND